MRRRAIVVLAVALAIAGARALVLDAPATSHAFADPWTWHVGTTSPRSLPGWALYDRYCLACHGPDGDGRGPAAPFTRTPPRDFTTGEFAWRTTPLGQPPTDDDLRLVITRGARGTSMPAFALAPAQLDQLVAVIKAFAPATFAQRTQPIRLAPPPAASDAARGARLFVEKGCTSCHGPTGSGDAVVARTATVKPYDLTREPLHRPGADLDARRAALLSIATGRATMPAYAGALPDADLWALADHVVAINASATPMRSDGRNAPLSTPSIDRDRDRRTAAATWPGPTTDPDAIPFGTTPLASQGPAPSTLAPVQASLSADQCARCHAKQHREWTGSRHHGAASPGLAAQMMGMQPADAAACLRCHAPLDEQRTDDILRNQGLSCAGCHLRGWTRHGPPPSTTPPSTTSPPAPSGSPPPLSPTSPTSSTSFTSSSSTSSTSLASPAPWLPGSPRSLLSLPNYPLTTLAIYERADFCLPCHQLPARTALEGRPLLDTYREWLEGPYMPRGIQCQHCHMPNREHTFLGVHDPATFRQAIALTARARRTGTASTGNASTGNASTGNASTGNAAPTTTTATTSNAAPTTTTATTTTATTRTATTHASTVSVVADVANVGAGHFVPTTPTPAAFLQIELLDAHNTPIPGATVTQRIGRDISFDGRWHQHADTRIPPGEHLTLARSWSGGRTADARTARITLTVHPDDYYEHLYTQRLATPNLAPARRALYEQALSRAKAARYVAEQRNVAITP